MKGRWTIRVLRIHLAGLFTCCFTMSTLAQTLVSRPSGYIRLDLAPAEKRLLSVPFESGEGSLASVLGGQVPQGTVLKWNNALNGYDAAYASSNGAWMTLDGAPSAMTLTPGEGFWLENHSPEGLSIFLVGALVLDDTNKLTLPSSLSLVGYPYSSPVLFTNTAMGQAFQNGTAPHDVMTDPTEEISTNGLLKLGHGYWYERGGQEPLVVDEKRPYSGDFPDKSSLLSIASIACNDGGVTLSIQLPDDAISIDVFSKDLPGDAVLTLESGWMLAAQDIPVTQSSVAWTDDRTSLATGVVGRVYLVGRADIDLDANGIPDGREKFVMGKGSIVSGGNAGQSLMDGTGGSAGENEEILDSESMVVISGSNIVEILYTSPVRASAVYVDQDEGSDTFSGAIETPAGIDGPKETINSGLDAVANGGSLNVDTGSYAEDLNLVGRGVDVRITGEVRLSSGVTGGTE